ncbi:MAG: restriction endonuclease subunit S [Flavipsychrobacter sp.]
MIELDKYKLGDIAEVFTGFPFKGDKYSDAHGTRVLRGENVSLGYLRWDTVKYWNENFNEFEKYSLKENDIVVGMDGSRVGRNRAQIKQTDLPLLLAQRVARIRAKKNYSQSLLSYIIKGEKFENYVNAVKTGTSIPHISARQINSFEFESPVNINVQDNIASILSSLDDKIELNLQMNQTLENMAQAIFEEWCCFKPQQMSSNWSLMKLSDLAEVTSSKRIFMDEYTDNGVPFYRGKEITQLSKGEKISTELFISDERYFDIKSKYGIPKIGDILITSVGTIGSIWIVDTELPFYFKDGNVTWVRGYKTIVTGQYIYQWLKTKDAQEQIKSLTIGSTQQALTISALKNLDIRIPDDSIVAKTIVELQAIYNKRQFNLNQIQTLTLIRDNLLPKLMTGKIEIKN